MLTKFLKPRTGLDRRRQDRTRGQSLVEFAIVLPIMLLLTLIALDFGRVYLGWINLQNMSRIAANLAANNPSAWDAVTPDPAVKAEYQNEILQDAAATNCDLPLVGGVRTAPAPVFTDIDGDGKPEIGDTASVVLTCQFGVITPGISNIVGSSVRVSASSVFPIKAGMTAAGGGAGSGGSAPVAAFTGNGIVAPSSLAGTAPFTVVFRDTSGGSPTSWLWNFNDGGPGSSLQDPLDHIFSAPGTYVVSMTATNSLGSSTATQGVTVTAAAAVDFTANTTSGNAPLAVTFTDASSPGGTLYAWTFGAGQGSATGKTVNHTYNTAGSYTVTLTVTYPTGSAVQTKTNYITVAPQQCVVPKLNDGSTHINQASGKWTANGFTAGNLSVGPGSPLGNGNWTIQSQTLTATSTVPCTASMQVNDH